MRDDGEQILEGSIVHVRRAFDGIAQCRHFEGVLHNDDVRHFIAAADVFVWQPNVMEAVVSEIPTRVASDAICLVIE